MRNLTLLGWVFLVVVLQFNACAEAPLMRDFMGLNGHFHFRPELYRPTCALVRNYQPMVWDIGNDGGLEPTLPVSHINIDGSGNVDWSKVYGSWKKLGVRIDVSLQFESIKPDAWKDLPGALEAYGASFARSLGPSSKLQLVESAEIGNEPSEYSDETYRQVFKNLATGLRKGDPKLKILTAAAMTGKEDKYSKNIDVLNGMESLYDAINIHSYSMIEGWPTWRRVQPEHPGIAYLKVIQDLRKWRDEHAHGKELWLTEFGYDASTKPAPKEGGMSKWVGSTETEQAQWIVRSFLVFSALGLNRAYLYYYNDEDQPSFHASSGITRDFVPKPSYWAMADLYQRLGDYRFSKVITEVTDELYIYEFINPAQRSEIVWAIWSPTGSQRESEKTFPIQGTPGKAERMPLKQGTAEQVDYHNKNSQITMKVGESPIYLSIRP